MKHRKLRIAWSVAWGIAALLIASLWVRSCWNVDLINIRIGQTSHLSLGSLPGACAGNLSNLDAGDNERSWWYVIDTESRRITGFDDDQEFAGIWGRFEFDWALAITLPDWFMIVTALAISAVPWLAWSCRFSVRAFLIATTLVAVGLGMIVWLAR